MPSCLHLDFETFVGSVDIREVGAYRYANDPSTEILCAAMAFDDAEPVAWDCTMEPWWAEVQCGEHLAALRDPEVLIWCHNAMFEAAICQALLQKTFGIPAPSLDRFRCTMSLARRAALPGKLEKLAEVLELGQQKDKRGKALIKKFCEMQDAKKPTKKNPAGLPVRRIRPEDEPEAFAELVAYCLQDVRTEQAVARKLAYFNDAINNANYTLDQKINARGVPVNLAALRHAQKLIDEETAIVSAQFRELCGFEVTQNAVLLKWANSGPYSFPNLQAETIDIFLEEHEEDEDPDEIVRGLRLKQSIAYVSIKKVKTMLECAGPADNRLRGLLNHHAATTGRWTSSLVQLQNLKRPTIKHSADAYRDICGGISREMLECCYGPVLEVMSSAVRHFIHDVCPACSGTGEGDLELEGTLSCSVCGGCHEPSFLDCDYSAVEARIVNWLAGQEDALEEYRQGVDRYKLMASVIYGVPAEKVNSHPQRFVGKQATLGCGFQMSPKKFRMTCWKMGRYKLPEGVEDIAVKAFRARHKKVVQLWYDTERAMQSAILRKGQQFPAGKHLRFLVKDIEGMPFMLMRLPSGRKLAYPQPKLGPSRKFEGKLEVTFFGNIKGQTWGRVGTYGASAVENATQAVAADIMAHGAHRAEANGFEIATLVHDQAIAYHHKGQTAEQFIEHLTVLPSWAAGLPLAAEGAAVPFYTKS